MKGKHKTFWGFFWRVFAGFLAFCVAAMAGFTYLAAQRQREMDISSMLIGANEAARSVGNAQRTGEIDADDERFVTTLRSMLSRKYYAGKSTKAELALIDADGELVAATKNYWHVMDDSSDKTTDYYIDLDRWLTESEQHALLDMIMDDWNKAMWEEPVDGDIQYWLEIEGWVDATFLIPRKILATAWRIHNVHKDGYSSSPTVGDIILFDREPENIDTTKLDYLTGLSGDSALLGGLTARGNGPLKMSYDEFAERRDDADRKALQDTVCAAKPIKGNDSAIEPEGELESLWKLQMIYRRLPVDAFGSAVQESPYTVVYGAVSYPLKTAVKQLAPVYGLCFVMVLVLSAMLAWRLNRVWKKQEMLEQVRRDTTNALAHELKTPLAVLSASAELLQSDLAADKRTHYLSVIQEQAARMDGSVKKMLDLSRLEAGAEQLRREPLSLAALAEDMLYAAAPLTEGMETRVVSDGADEALADRALLTRALDSLLGNAVRFTPVGGRITVRIENGVCAVENTGEPIGEDILPRLWDAYYQGDPARTDEGTGLGLAIARAVFELHGYPFGAENGADGPRFWFRFGK